MRNPSSIHDGYIASNALAKHLWDKIVAMIPTKVSELEQDVTYNSGRKINEPELEGTSGQVLTTNGFGGRYWSPPGGHEHSNKSVLDSITQALINTWNTVTGKISEPSSEGTSGQALATDGSGGRSWKSYVQQGIGASTLRAVQLNEDPSKTTASTFVLSNAQSEYHGDTFKAGTGIDTYDPATNRQGKYAVVMNEASFACGNNAVAQGHNCVAKGDCSYATGESTVASGGNSRTSGRYTVASGFNSQAEGWGSVASGNQSRAGGYYTKATGSRAYSNGVNTVAAGENSFTTGEETSTGLYGFYSVLHKKADLTFTLDSVSGLEVGDTFSAYNTSTQRTFNNVSTISAIDSTSKTVTVTSWGSMSFSTTTIPTYFWVSAKPTIGTHLLNSDITGMENYGFNSSVFGKGTSAIGNRAFANGYQSRAEGNNSFVSGYLTLAGGPNSHAEGRRTTASGNGAHAEGYNSDTSSTTASGDGSHAEGIGTTAVDDASHVEGKYNASSQGFAHVLGNGTSESALSNAHTIDWSGNAWFSGDIKVGGTGYSSASAWVASLPSYSSSDNGKVLKIVNGAPTWTTA